MGATFAKLCWTMVICSGVMACFLAQWRGERPHAFAQPSDSGGLDEAVALVEELQHTLAALEVGRVRGELEPLARPWQRHVQHLADARGRTIGHHHDAVR